MRRNIAASSNEKSMTTSSSSPSNNNNTTTEFDDQKTSLLLSSSKMKPTYNPNVFPTFETLNLQAMKQKILDMKEEMKNLTNLTNYYRRIYYAESELMIMDIEYLLKLKTNYNFNDIELQLQEILEECTLISKQLKLQYSNKLTNNNNGNKRNILLYLLYKLDELSRSIAVFIFFIFSGLCLTLPCILLCIRSFDTWLVRNNIISPFNQISNTVKAFISHMILRISGIELNIEGFQSDYFGKDCSIICFSHSSTIDAFVITLAIPVRHYTLAKAELFLVPFFSWHLLAYGGIPIDRSNRDQAIEAIGIAAEAAGVGDTVAVSPEGTRSTTGQIVAFKKGPFHLWESLKTPIIPLVIYGAFDLLPPSNLMAIPGKVYARYLPPTYSTQAKTREEMSYLIRKQMLLAWKDGPKDAGNSLSWKSQLITQFYVFIVYLSTYLCYQYLPVYIILNKYNLSKMQLTGIITGFCIGITFLFYIYLLYLKPLFKRLIYGSKRRSTGSGAGSSSNNNNSGIASSNGNTKESRDKE